MRTIVWIIYFVFSLICTIPSLLKAKRYDNKNKISERDVIVDKVARKWAKGLVNITGSKVEVKGQENIPKSQAVLFVSNHQGNFDIPILLGFIDKQKAFISKAEVKKIPIIKPWMELMHCVFMDRKNMRQSAKAIIQGVKNLKSGYSLVIFPEGTRSKDGSLGTFKPGSLKLATKAKIPIIPITINGTKNIMEKRSFVIKPSDVEIIISPPITAEEYSNKDTKQIAEEVRNIIAKNLK